MLWFSLKRLSATMIVTMVLTSGADLPAVHAQGALTRVETEMLTPVLERILARRLAEREAEDIALRGVEFNPSREILENRSIAGVQKLDALTSEPADPISQEVGSLVLPVTSPEPPVNFEWWSGELTINKSFNFGPIAISGGKRNLYTLLAATVGPMIACEKLAGTTLSTCLEKIGAKFAGAGDSPLNTHAEDLTR